MINDIITAMEKECAVAEFQFDKANMLFEMVEKNHEMMYQEASVMVYANDRSYDDLCALYEAADAETNEKKGGILSSLIDAVLGIFRAIGNAITSLFKKNNNAPVPEKVEMSKYDAETIDLLDEFANDSGKAVSMLTSPKTWAGILAGLGTLVGGGCLLHKHFSKKADEQSNQTVTVNGNDVKNKLNVISTIQTNIDKLLNGIKNKLGIPDVKNEETNNRGLIGKLKFIGNKLKDYVTKAQRWLNWTPEERAVASGDPSAYDKFENLGVKKEETPTEQTPDKKEQKK